MKKRPSASTSGAGLGLLEKLKRDAGRGVSTKLVDTAFWLEDIDDPDYRPWYEALEAIDRARDAKAMRAAQRTLCALLCGPVPERVGSLLADLLARYRLTRRAGRPATPAYERTPAMLELEWAYETLRAYLDAEKAKGKLAKQVIDDAIFATVRKHPQVTLKSLWRRYHKGSHGGTRRHKAKLVKTAPPRS